MLAGEAAASRTERRGFAFTAALLFAVMGVALAAQLPVTGGIWPAAQRSAYALVWPQRWGFFAGGPDTGVVVVYVLGSRGTLDQAPGQRHMTAAGGWGVGRSSDTLQQEIGYLVRSIPADLWTPCAAGDVSGCRVDRTYRTVNTFPAPQLCGRVTLAVLGPDDRRADPGGTGRRVQSVLPAELVCPAR